MIFEDAVRLVHDLSEKLAIVVELKGDLVMTPQGTSQEKHLRSQISDLTEDINFLIDECCRVGFDRITRELITRDLINEE